MWYVVVTTVCLANRSHFMELDHIHYTPSLNPMRSGHDSLFAANRVGINLAASQRFPKPPLSVTPAQTTIHGYSTNTGPNYTAMLHI